MIQLTVQPNPFEPPYFCELEAGQTLEQILGGIHDDVRVQVNDLVIPHSVWDIYRPADDDIIVARKMPEGIISSLVTIATVVSTVATVASVVMSVVQLLVKPQQPKSPRTDVGRFNALLSGTNQDARYGPLPKLYGHMRIIPPIASMTRTSHTESSQFLHMFFCLGHGALEIGGIKVGKSPVNGALYGADGAARINHLTTLPADTVRIGQNDFSNYSGIQFCIGRKNQMFDPDGKPLPIRDMVEETLAINFTHSDLVQGDWVDNYQTYIRTTAPDTWFAEIEIAWPNLFSVDKKGKDQTAGTRFHISYSVKDADVWTVVNPQWETVKSTRNPYYRTFRITFPTPGQYDVRVRRTQVQGCAGGMTASTNCTWYALRSTQSSSIWPEPQGSAADDAVLMWIRVKASNQLNGSLDAVSIEATAVQKVWNGSAFVDQATTNPAWAYANVLQGRQLSPRVRATDAQIDWAALLDWANWCNSNAIEYNYYHTQDETVSDRLMAVAAAGFATRGWANGRFTAVRDTDFTPRQLITPRNSSGFSFSRTFVPPPHGFRVKYVDFDTNNELENSAYDDGYTVANAQEYEVLETQGCNDPTLAWKHGRYHLAQRRLRTEVYSCTMDLENLILTRGDCARLTSDVLLVARHAGRAVSWSGNLLTLDEAVTFSPGEQYAILVRREDGTQTVQPIYNDFSQETTTNLITMTGSLTGVNPGDLVVFGEHGIESMLVKVSDIEYNADWSATLRMVYAAPTIFDAWTGTIPEWDPMVSLPPEMKTPPTPIIVSLTSGGDTLSIGTDGEIVAAVNIAWRIPLSPVFVDTVEIEYTYGDNVARVLRVSTDQISTRIGNLPIGKQVDVRIRGRSIYDRWSLWSGISSVLTASPTDIYCPEPTNFTATGTVSMRPDGTVDNNILLEWDPPVEGAFEKYEVEWREAGGTTWDGVNVSRATEQLLLAALNPLHNIDARLRCKNMLGVPSIWLELFDLTPGLKATPPGPITDFAVVGDLRTLNYSWVNPVDDDYSHTEIWVSQTNDRTTATRAAEIAGTAYAYAVPGFGQYYAWGRALDRTGNTSTWTPAGIYEGLSGYAQDEWDKGINVQGPSMYNGFEGTDYDRWQTTGGVTLARSPLAYTGQSAGLVTGDGSNGDIRFFAPDGWAEQYASRRVRVQCYARGGTATQGTLGIVFNGVTDVNMLCNLTGSYQQFGFLAAIPASATSAYIYFKPSGSGSTALVDSVAGWVVSDMLTADNIDLWVATAAIGGAYIADASIDTLKLAGQTVNVPRYGYGTTKWSGASKLSPEVCSVACKAVQPNTRGSIMLTVLGNVTNGAEEVRAYRVYIYRQDAVSGNDTAGYTWGSATLLNPEKWIRTSVGAGRTMTIGGCFADAPPETACRYSIKLYRPSTLTAQTTAQLSFIAQEVKR